MEVQALPLAVSTPAINCKDTLQAEARTSHAQAYKTTIWEVLWNTLGLGLFLFSLLVFFDLLSLVI